MKCKRCGTENPDAKRTCMECGAILEGYTFNNVTGEYGYRGADGNFYKNESGYRARISAPQSWVTSCSNDFVKPIELPEPIGYLYADYAQKAIAVFEPIGWFKRLMLRWCFGLKYEPITNEKENRK